MKILVSLLTSNRLDLLSLSYNSVIQQQNHTLDFDVVIIVNSKNPQYIHDVKNKFNEMSCKIVETESNGYPGKGHNSVLMHFKEHIEYDYCLMLDGDDFLYPRAFSRLSHYLCYNPDVLFLCFHDNIKNNIFPHEVDVPHITIEQKIILFYNITRTTVSMWHEIKGKNPFQYNINDLNSPARPFLFSRKSIIYDIFYDENMKLYDDFIVFMKCFEHSKLGNLKVFGLFDSDIYLYNLLPTENASTKYNNDSKNNYSVRENENFNFIKSIKNKYLTLKDWNLKNFPTLELDQMNETDNFKIKYNFLCKVLKELNLPELEHYSNNVDTVLKYCLEHNNLVFYQDLKSIFN
jgi:hypothetical protein